MKKKLIDFSIAFYTVTYTFFSGFNRAFQPSDGACVCLSGYIYYDEVDQLQSEGRVLVVINEVQVN